MRESDQELLLIVVVLCVIVVSVFSSYTPCVQESIMGFYEELDQYEARAEYEAWLDEQEDFMVRCHEQEMSPEVVE